MSDSVDSDSDDAKADQSSRGGRRSQKLSHEIRSKGSNNAKKVRSISKCNSASKKSDIKSGESKARGRQHTDLKKYYKQSIDKINKLSIEISRAPNE
jgi:hypothetical protein